jgi:hypothetical protein
MMRWQEVVAALEACALEGERLTHYVPSTYRGQRVYWARFETVG